MLILLLTFFQFYSVVSRNSKVNNFASSLFLWIIIRSGLLAEIWWLLLLLLLLIIISEEVSISFSPLPLTIADNKCLFPISYDFLHTAQWYDLNKSKVHFIGKLFKIRFLRKYFSCWFIQKHVYWIWLEIHFCFVLFCFSLFFFMHKEYEPFIYLLNILCFLYLHQHFIFSSVSASV